MTGIDAQTARWMENLIQALQAQFSGRIVCVGLQGSRARGEASPESDIDAVVILDRLSYADLTSYGCLLDAMERRDLFCGFISGQAELANWETAELFQFYHDTQCLLGDLSFLRPLIDGESIRRAVRDGACAVYHACAHNVLHQRSAQALSGVLKSARFAIQARHYLETGEYIAHRRELANVRTGAEREIILLSENPGRDFNHASALLFDWAGGVLRDFSQWDA